MNHYTQTLRNIGKVESCSRDVKNGSGSLLAVQLLDELIASFADYSSLYINATGEAPFTYRERQLSSLLSPALASVATAFLAELPIGREKVSLQKGKSKINKRTGWVDFWAEYKGYEFFIELKHSYDSIRTQHLRKEAVSKWHEMTEVQLPNLEKEAIQMSANRKGIFTLALHVISIYHYRKKGGIDTMYYPQKLIDTRDRIFDEINTSNWCAVWSLHDNLVEDSKYEDDTHLESYPGVVFLAKIKKIH